MQAVLNVSTTKPNMKYLGVYGWKSITRAATHPESSKMRKYARRVIQNLGKHKSNRTRIYKLELRLKKRIAHGIQQVISDKDLAERIWKTTGTGPYGGSSKGGLQRKHRKTISSSLASFKSGNSTMPLATARSLFEDWCEETFHRDASGRDKKAAVGKNVQMVSLQRASRWSSQVPTLASALRQRKHCVASVRRS